MYSRLLGPQAGETSPLLCPVTPLLPRAQVLPYRFEILPEQERHSVSSREV